VDVLSRESVGAQERVLEDTDDGRVVGGTDDLPWNSCKIAQLGCALNILWHMKIHLITIKVSIVRLGITYVHPERVTDRHDLGDVAHH